VLLTRTLKSSTFRLALACVASFSAAVFLLLGYVYWATMDYVRSRADRTIGEERARLIEAYDRGGRAGIVAAIEDRMAERSFGASVYLLADTGLAPLAGNLPRWPASLHSGDGWTEITPPAATAAGSASDGPIRLRYGALPDGSHLLVGQAFHDLEGFVGSIKMALGAGGVMTLLMAMVAGAFVTRRTVGRIESINATTREIMGSDLTRRIPLRGTKDEWDQLAANLNAMLDRIDELVGEVRQVSDNVAHDLRTPLTRLQGRLEQAYHQRLDPEGCHALIGDTLADVTVILRTFASLLRISRVESLEPKSAFRVVDLGTIAGEVAELFDAAAEERGGRVRFASQGRVPVWGDRDLLFDALSNIIDNAIKYGAPKDGASPDRALGDISVEVGLERHGATICVGDHGPGIPLEERGNVLKRFYRLDRSRSSPGNGLGLSLVAAVVQLHDARLDMEDNAPGLKVRLRFPPLDDRSGASPRMAQSGASA
jgi:signal transduction histidine kinase